MNGIWYYVFGFILVWTILALYKMYHEDSNLEMGFPIIMWRTHKFIDFIDKLALKESINKLPEKEKEVIMLRYFRDMTQSEIASILGISQVQVSRIENRVLGELKKSMSE